MEICKCCGGEVRGTRLALWDGRIYCAECVGGRDRCLLDAVKGGRPLEQTLPFGVCRIAIEVFLCYVLAFAVGGMALGAACAGGSGDNGKGMVLWGCFVIFGVAFGAIVSLPVAIRLREHRPFVSVDDGMLTIRTPDAVRTVALSTCTWRIGWTGQIGCGRLFYGVFLLRPAVIISLPGTDDRDVKWIVNAGVGYTAAQRKLWMAFLDIASTDSRVRNGRREKVEGAAQKP